MGHIYKGWETNRESSVRNVKHKNKKTKNIFFIHNQCGETDSNSI